MTDRLSPDHHNLVAGSAAVPGLCLMSAIWPETEDFIGYGLIGAAALALGAAALRRELRIRRRLAEIQPLPVAEGSQTVDPRALECGPSAAATSGVSMTKVA